MLWIFLRLHARVQKSSMSTGMVIGSLDCDDNNPGHPQLPEQWDGIDNIRMALEIIHPQTETSITLMPMVTVTEAS